MTALDDKFDCFIILLLRAKKRQWRSQLSSLTLQLQGGKCPSFHHNWLTSHYIPTNDKSKFLHQHWDEFDWCLVGTDINVSVWVGRQCLHTGLGYALFAFRCLPFVFSSEKFLSHIIQLIEVCIYQTMCFYWRKRCCLQQAGCNFAIAQGTAGVGNVYYLLLLPF